MTSDPCDKEPSFSIRVNRRSNAFSKATSFCNSSEAGVRAMRSSKASLRTGSRASPRALTSLGMPNGAVRIHSCVLSGRALEI
ncbi:hypothetical protein BDV24DRAFT_143762 [Aspergillus arachidicola]|uniref:Uncharacterized protein n=1 Tax=Aspergillus arachidicola TaxID=656916 RepID=A0A5N6XR89_9EURO|nr:hypothetical protein BDV24DRAFT_143762 [Aspergillus arachidicola]